MSHPPYMPLWIGDYLRDTQHLSTEQHGAYLLLIAHCWQHGALPPDAAGRAQIVRLLPVSRWNKIKAPVEAFFAPDGTHGRVEKERARAEHLNAVRSVAGSKGGLRSAATRAKHTASKTRGPPQANSQATTQPNVTAIQRQNRSSAQAYQTKNQNLTSSSEYEAASAREAAPQEVIETEQQSPAGSLATAPGVGALTRPPVAVPDATPPKPPSELTRAELEATFERRRANEAAAAEHRRNRVWGRGQPPPPAASNAVEKQEPDTP